MSFFGINYLIGDGDAATIAAEPEEFISFGVWGDSATYNTRDSLF